MYEYLNLVATVLRDGEVRNDRTGVGTISCFGLNATYDLRRGFPLLTTKKVRFDSVVKELLWFLRGETNVNTLGCGIWDAWADENGDLGPIYGHNWRSWGKCEGAPGVDQIADVIDGIKRDPYGRRHIVSAWNVADLPKMALPPCHLLFQFYVSTQGWLDCKLYQRSADLALGVPFNIASYALLLTMVAHATGYNPRFLHHSFGDVHIYQNHVEGLKLQMSRPVWSPPQLVIEGPTDIDQIREEHIHLRWYDPHPAIRFEVAV